MIRRFAALVAIVALLSTANPSAFAHSSDPPGTDQRESVPDGIPRTAAEAFARARHWRSDAQLVSLEVSSNGAGGKFQTRCGFYSPSDGEGLWVIGDQQVPAGSVSWPTKALPLTFLDLPAAVAQAQRLGMQGAMDRAELTIGSQGLEWSVAPAQATNSSNYNIQAGPAASSYPGAATAPTGVSAQPPKNAAPNDGWSDYNRTHSTSGNSGIHWLPPGTAVGVGQDK